MSMDRYLTACTAMDALTHAIEAYVSSTHSALTDVHALESIRLINQVIEKSVMPQRSIETMYELMLGSLQAGLAFSNASLGAVHAMSHSMGGLLDLPHGEV
jgi:Alcohol dehydrogenase, class IV